MMVEEYLERDNRAVLPLGSTEQHAYLSLSVDSILAERLAAEAAEPLDIPVFPVLTYGITPYFRAFPGTITLRVETYLSILRDILETMAMAQAELGQFTEAVTWQKEAIAASEKSGERGIAGRITDNLRLYESRRPCRTPWRSDEPIEFQRTGGPQAIQSPNP